MTTKWFVMFVALQTTTYDDHHENSMSKGATARYDLVLRTWTPDVMLLNDSLSLSHGPALPNRIAKSAMSERLATAENRPSVELLRLYERWGASGAGLLITGNVMVDRTALGETGNVVVDDERDLPALTHWAKVAKHRGSRIWMQINHPGRQSPRVVSHRPVAPSPVRVEMMGPMFAMPRELRASEIESIVSRFAQTAQVAEKAGFDGVQIHGAHGYLISQFLSPRTNLRNDRWGGDSERRRAFLLEVIRAIRGAVSPHFSVGLKLNSADFQRGGFTEQESMALLRVLDHEALDMIEVSGGTYESAKMFEETVPKAQSSRQREAFFLDYVEKVRALVKTPMLLTGGFRTRTGMDIALSGPVDMIGLARPLAIDPEFPNRLLRGDVQTARPIRLAVGIKSIDALLQGAWYQVQMDRMGRGLEPDPDYARIWALLNYFKPRRGTPWTPPQD